MRFYTDPVATTLLYHSLNSKTGKVKYQADNMGKWANADGN